MISKKQKNELNILSLRNMLKEQPTTETHKLAVAIHNLASSMKLVIEKPNDGELMQAVLENLDNVSSDMHKILFKQGETK